MKPDVAEHAKISIQEYAQRNSAMGGCRSYQGIQYGICQKSSSTTIIKSSIVLDNKSLVSVLLGEQFRLGMMFPQRAKEAPKTSEGIPFLLTVSIQEKQENIKDRDSRNTRVELTKTVIHQLHISVQQ